MNPSAPNNISIQLDMLQNSVVCMKIPSQMTFSFEIQFNFRLSPNFKKMTEIIEMKKINEDATANFLIRAKFIIVHGNHKTGRFFFFFFFCGATSKDTAR